MPKAVRQSLGLTEGDHVAFVERGGEVVLRAVRQSLRDLRGSVPTDGPHDADDLREAVRHDRAARHAATEPTGEAVPPATPEPSDPDAR